MLSDYECALLSAACYWQPEEFDTVISGPNLQWTGIKKYPDCIVVAKRGSTIIPDWFRDFCDLALMIDDPQLGRVHPGFVEWLRETHAQYPESDLPWVYTGHSLGAGEAFLDAAQGVLMGQKVAKVCVFGPPRPGGGFIRETLALVPGTAYKNRCDPVADVPFDIPIFEPYLEPYPITRVNVAPPPNDDWLNVADHHAQLYCKALAGDTPLPGWLPAL